MTKRDLVFAKYNGHCAYCGQKIEIKDMQISKAISNLRKLKGISNDR